MAQNAADMISARLTDGAGLIQRLSAKAATLARAHAENRLLARRQDAGRWRRAGLLWPLFTKDR